MAGPATGQISPITGNLISDGKSDLGPVNPIFASSGPTDGVGGSGMIFPSGVTGQGSQPTVLGPRVNPTPQNGPVAQPKMPNNAATN